MIYAIYELTQSTTQQLGLHRSHFSLLKSVSTSSALSFDQWAGLIFDTMQEWWRWLVRKARTREKVSVSGMRAASWNNVYVLDIFSPTPLSAASPEKSPDSLLAISLPALCWISREVRMELPNFLVSWGHRFLIPFWSVITVAYLSLYKTEGKILSKDKLISSTDVTFINVPPLNFMLSL